MRAITTLALLLPFLLNAQSWCAPGATWTYEAGLFLGGYRQMTYTRDSIVDGQSAQVIDQRAVIQYPQPTAPYWSEPHESHTAIAVITRGQADVVFIWSSSNATWDTLYWYGATIGDHWYPAHMPENEDCAALVVSDTGTTVFDDLPLRWLEISGQRVYERIGPELDMFLYGPNWIVDGPMGIRCYSDDAIAIGFTGHGCETLVGVQEQGTTLPIPYPNPGTTYFNLELSPGMHTVELFDATGRRVQEWRTTGGRVTIDTRDRAAGLHLVRVDHGDHQRWLKH